MSLFSKLFALTKTPLLDSNRKGLDNGTVSQIEAAIFKYTNIERTKIGKIPYEYDLKLSIIARNWSKDRLDNNYYPNDHVDKVGRDPTGRAIAGGYQIPIRTWEGGCTNTWVGENQAMISGLRGTPEEIGYRFVVMWMGSPGHKSAIIDDPNISGLATCMCNGKPVSCGFKNIGIGVALKGTTYHATQNFV